MITFQFMLKIILLVVIVTIASALISSTDPVLDKITSRSNRHLSLSGTPYVLQTPVRLYLKLSFMFEQSIAKTYVLMSSKSEAGTMIKLQIHKTTLYIQIKPSNRVTLGTISKDKLNTLSMHILDPSLIINFNNRQRKFPLADNLRNFRGSQITFGRSKHTYDSPMCTITSFFIRNQLQDLRKAIQIERAK